MVGVIDGVGVGVTGVKVSHSGALDAPEIPTPAFCISDKLYGKAESNNHILPLLWATYRLLSLTKIPRAEPVGINGDISKDNVNEPVE